MAKRTPAKPALGPPERSSDRVHVRVEAFAALQFQALLQDMMLRLLAAKLVYRVLPDGQRQGYRETVAQWAHDAVISLFVEAGDAER